jgi:hypothetical protein
MKRVRTLAAPVASETCVAFAGVCVRRLRSTSASVDR